MRETLFERTITVIANEGLDKTTTKQIVAGTGINEVYIYRQFKGKEDLLAGTFERLDEELVSKIMQHIEIMYVAELDFETRCRVFFMAIWRFLLSSKKKCLAFVRYYYSPYFLKYSINAHKERYLKVVERFRDAFIEEVDVWMILSHILNVMLDFAVKAHTVQMPKEDSYTEHVYRVIYASIKQYFKGAKEDVF